MTPRSHEDKIEGADIHRLMKEPLDILIDSSGRGETWSLRGDRFKQRSDKLPGHLRSAFSSAGAVGFSEFLVARTGNRPWAIEMRCDGICFSRDLFYELAIEHGYKVLFDLFTPFLSEKDGYDSEKIAESGHSPSTHNSESE